RDYLARLNASGDLFVKLYESAVFHGVPGIAAKRVVAIAGGKREKFSLYELRRVAGAAVRLLKPRQLKEIVFVPDGMAEDHEAVQASVEGAIVADFDPGRYKTEGRNDDKHLGGFKIAVQNTSDLQVAVEVGRIIGESQNFARELVNEPGNQMTPT